MRPARVLTLAAALAATLAAGCARPPDEAWLRFLGFRASGATTALTALEGKLLDGKTELVDAELENGSVRAGDSAAGTGILVKRVRVAYRTAVGVPPAFEYPVALYLPARSAAGEDPSGTLSGVPIVPSSLKEWLRASGQPLDPHLRFTALVTFLAETDDGNELEVDGGLAVTLTNAGSSSAGADLGD